MSTVRAKAKADVVYGDFTPNKGIRRKINVRTPLGERNTHWVVVEHKEDPKQAILRKIGTVPKELIQFARIVVAIYQPPMVDKTAGGVYLTEQMKKEDMEEYYWQGKVGLIVAMGPRAYVDDDTYKFHGTRNHIGDWVWFQPSNGIACEVNEVMCRVFTEQHILGKVDHPDQIW